MLDLLGKDCGYSRLEAVETKPITFCPSVYKALKTQLLCISASLCAFFTAAFAQVSRLINASFIRLDGLVLPTFHSLNYKNYYLKYKEI